MWLLWQQSPGFNNDVSVPLFPPIKAYMYVYIDTCQPEISQCSHVALFSLTNAYNICVLEKMTLSDNLFPFITLVLQEAEMRHSEKTTDDNIVT